MICEWCGTVHDLQSLCTPRPKWGRRGFITLVGTGLVGASLKLPDLLTYAAEFDPLVWAATATPRQVLAEFGAGLMVESVGPQDSRRWWLKDLLPDRFRPEAPA